LAVTTETVTNHFDLSTASSVHSNLSNAELVELALARGEGVLADNGALVSSTGAFTGRTPGNKAIVREPGSEENVWWENNKEISPTHFSLLKSKVQDYLANKDLNDEEAYCGADHAGDGRPVTSR
jgi:phosphoenolpyruvate carboxykinase (ATP)